jgi:cell division protein FtsZ
MGILTVGVVTKPFSFEGSRRMRLAEAGITELQKSVDTLIVIPNQNLFRVANEHTTFADAFAMADKVLYSGVACITDLMVKEGLINLDFADVRAVMREMGKAMMGTGEASGEKRALRAAEAAIANPLLDDVNMKGARGLLISITGGSDLTLYEVDEAATRIREEVDSEANVIFGATRDDSLEGIVRVSVVATGIDHAQMAAARDAGYGMTEQRIGDITDRLRTEVNQASRPFARPEARPEISTAPAAPIQAPVPAQPQALPAQTHHDVTIRPAAVRPIPAAPAVEPAPEPVAVQAPHPATFVPPRAEEPVRAPRMPRIEDLPPVAQASIEASRSGYVQQPVEKKRTTLMERLAQAGFGRRSEREDVAVPQPRTVAAPAFSPAPEVRPELPPQPGAVHQEFAKRTAQPTRPAPQQRMFEDDQLEIPAFLRRQSN